MDVLNFSQLKRNLALNDCYNAEVHNVAASDAAGRACYRRDVDGPSPSFRLEAKPQGTNSAVFVPVDALTLDEFLRDKEAVPDVVEVDVGAEMNVLTGMKQTMRDGKPKLYLEIHPATPPAFNASASALLSLLGASNYEVFEIEEMRSQEPGGRLKRLSAGSTIENNTMLYAGAREGLRRGTHPDGTMNAAQRP
jgi:FkbM family methyltransferase